MKTLEELRAEWIKSIDYGHGSKAEAATACSYIVALEAEIERLEAGRVYEKLVQWLKGYDKKD